MIPGPSVGWFVMNGSISCLVTDRLYQYLHATAATLHATATTVRATNTTAVRTATVASSIAATASISTLY